MQYHQRTGPCCGIYCIYSCMAEGHRNGDWHRSDAPLGTEGNLLIKILLGTMLSYLTNLLSLRLVREVGARMNVRSSFSQPWAHCDLVLNPSPHGCKASAFTTELPRSSYTYNSVHSIPWIMFFCIRYRVPCCFESWKYLLYKWQKLGVISPTYPWYIPICLQDIIFIFSIGGDCV